LSKLQLPKQDENGDYYLSYSQISSFNEAKGFDTGLLGRHEYIRKYFLGEKFDRGLGFDTFGAQVENFICLREDAEAFDVNERKLLETIKPLGLFQHKFKLQFEDFYLMGYIDDMTPDKTYIRDYKTCSRNSGKKYETLDYKQLSIYAAAVEQEVGKLPVKTEVCCISRNGNPFRGGGRSVLSVGDEVWYIDRTEMDLNPDRIQSIKDEIVETANEISEYWKVFCELNKI
jgi:hypothetical protein